jgi:hypothetical protein
MCHGPRGHAHTRPQTAGGRGDAPPRRRHGFSRWALMLCLAASSPHTTRAQVGPGARWGAAAPYDASSLSVLSRFATHGRLVLKPYPYIVINDALPPDLYRALEASFLTDR